MPPLLLFVNGAMVTTRPWLGLPPFLGLPRNSELGRKQ